MEFMIEQALLGEMQCIWKHTPEHDRPNALWISCHEAIDECDTTVNSSPVTKAWYFDAKRLHAKRAIEYVRFMNVHSGDIFSTGLLRPRSHIFCAHGDTHEIGLIAFAPVKETELYYFHWLFGGKFGRGFYCAVHDDGTVEHVRDVWVA